MIVSEIDSQQPNPTRAHVNRQAQRNVRRVLRVVQHVGIREIRAALLSQRESDDVVFPETKVELRKDEFRLRAFHITKAIAGKLVGRIHYHEIVGLKLPPNIVNADGDELLGMLELIQRLSTSTNKYGPTLMNVRK